MNQKEWTEGMNGPEGMDQDGHGSFHRVRRKRTYLSFSESSSVLDPSLRHQTADNRPLCRFICRFISRCHHRCCRFQSLLLLLPLSLLLFHQSCVQEREKRSERRSARDTRDTIFYLWWCQWFLLLVRLGPTGPERRRIALAAARVRQRGRRRSACGRERK